MKKSSLILAFFISSFWTLFSSVFFPDIRIFSFAPFFAILYHRTSYLRTLWCSAGCGLILDLFSTQYRFGLYCLSLSSASAFLYFQKKHFFEEKSHALAIFSVIISSISNVCLVFFALFMEKGLFFNWSWFLSDCFLMPIIDGFFAFLFIILPMQFYLYLQKRRFSLFLKKQEEEVE